MIALQTRVATLGLLLFIAILALAGAQMAGAGQAELPRMSAGQSSYLLGCGGCHGIGGSSVRSGIPELRNHVGRFLCSAAGRAYIVRLPNVAFANMDDELLAQVMNFVVFTLGEQSVPPGAAPYTAREIAILRSQPLKNSGLEQIRQSLLVTGPRSCGK